MVDYLYKAYGKIEIEYEERLKNLEKKFDILLKLSKECRSDLIKEFKPTIAITLKWKFDYLNKTYESPFELESDLDHWIKVFQIFKKLGNLEWYKFNDDKNSPDVWQRTAEGFDLGWTSTTKKEDFENSQKIAKDRLDQIIELIGDKNYFHGKEIFDSGCGPGRYIDLISKMNPKKIIGMDQGDLLISALTERFKGNDKIQIDKGSCHQLEKYADNSFDFVFSNGVLHHTPHDMPTMIAEHSRVLKKDGIMFIMLVGHGGLELKIWEFIRGFLFDVPLKNMLNQFSDKLSPLRMQGIVDHMYGEYQQITREKFETVCNQLFSKLVPVPGIDGLDVTPEIYVNDPYFKARFGSGHMRYLCYK